MPACPKFTSRVAWGRFVSVMLPSKTKYSRVCQIISLCDSSVTTRFGQCDRASVDKAKKDQRAQGRLILFEKSDAIATAQSAVP